MKSRPPPLYELKSNVAELHNSSIVKHSTTLAWCIRTILSVEPLYPLRESVRLGDLAILLVYIAHVPLWERRQDVIMLHEVSTWEENNMKIDISGYTSNLLTPFIVPNSTLGIQIALDAVFSENLLFSSFHKQTFPPFHRGQTPLTKRQTLSSKETNVCFLGCHSKPISSSYRNGDSWIRSAKNRPKCSNTIR
jgi:hypothetical protein